MKMTSLKLTNFRGYKDTIEIYFDNLTVFVGENDIGKSTILEALDIFYNEGKGIIKMDKGDVNKQAASVGDTETIISVCFVELPAEIVIDAANPTTLADEYMINEQSQLEIVKRYRNGGGVKIYIKAKHPTNPDCTDLLLKKNTELKAIIRTQGIECENQNINAVMRAAIWGLHLQNLQLQEIEIDVSKEDAKKIWDKLYMYLPVYSLFQSDRKNSDGDNEVQDPLKEAVRKILTDDELRTTLNRVASEVEAKLREVVDRTMEKLREMAPDVANSLNPVIPLAESLKWADVFKSVSISGDEDIPINKRGSGVKRLILLNFFRAEAERRMETSDSTGVIYAIEEPETSQHTNNQRILVEAFKTLGNSANTQVILTSHSATIVKQLDYSNLRMITCDGDRQRRMMEVAPGMLHYPSLNEVNYIAFKEITEEYHDELYSFLEFQQWLSDYKMGRNLLPYIRLNNDGNTRNEQHIVASYIRHQIHHPENHLNPRYTLEQLKQSIDDMRNYIHTRANQEGVLIPHF
ncbi:MAG: ATP/GTP-binding protein [Firmicutes bacterium HGW-Firmicutes-1]|jgi:predicted ATP-dependent endonuclease of OLD family|nr:MAG: ATP/GTP-binding protein [Firmicutes bacterium HGW-Firmicutes-1]